MEQLARVFYGYEIGAAIVATKEPRRRDRYRQYPMLEPYDVDDFYNDIRSVLDAVDDEDWLFEDVRDVRERIRTAVGVSW